MFDHGIKVMLLCDQFIWAMCNEMQLISLEIYVQSCLKQDTQGLEKMQEGVKLIKQGIDCLSSGMHMLEGEEP